MKRLLVFLPFVIIIVIGIIAGYDKPEYREVTGDEIVDPDFFKNTLNSEILDFAFDVGMDPDSIYLIP